MLGSRRACRSIRPTTSKTPWNCWTSRASGILDRPAKTVYYLPKPGEDMTQGRGDCAGGGEARRTAGHARSARAQHPFRGHHLRARQLAAAQQDRALRRAGQLHRRFRPQGFVHSSRGLRQRAQREPEERGQRGLPRGQVDPLRALHVHPTGRGRLGYRGRLAGQRGLGLPVLRHFGHGRADRRRAQGRPSSGRSAEDRQEQLRWRTVTSTTAAWTIAGA